MAADVPLNALRDDGRRRVPDPPALDAVVEDTGRQRLAAYYLYSALIAGVIGNDDLLSGSWPLKLAEPMQRMGLIRLAPKTDPGLDAQLTPAEQSARRSPGRQSLFAQFLVGLINQGAFGPLCGDADSVRLREPGPEDGADLELINDQRVVDTCKVQDHWELVAQYLAGVPLFATEAATGSPRATEAKLASQLKETGISHTVSLATTLAVSIHPLGAAAGLGTRLVRERIKTDRDEAGTLRYMGEELGSLRADATGLVRHLQSRRTG